MPCVNVQKQANSKNFFSSQTVAKTGMSLPTFQMPDNCPKDVRIERLPRHELDRLSALNFEIFREKRIINHQTHPFLVVLAAFAEDIPVGFKIGYGRKEGEFYSAKGGVLPAFRRQKLAESMMHEMIRIAREARFRTFTYDTFPNMNPGMLIMGLNFGFKVTYTGYNARYSDYQVTLSLTL